MRQELNKLVGNHDEARDKLAEWGMPRGDAEKLLDRATATDPWTGTFDTFPLTPQGRIATFAYAQFEDGEYHIWTEF